MIINKRHENSILSRLEASSFEFYLTGSRFFGGFTATSDWDYFVQDSDSVRQFLISTGFLICENDLAKYDDSTVVDVCYLNDIHIQLVNDAIFKDKVQTFLSKNCEMRSLPKIARKHVWNLAIKFVSQSISESYLRY